MDESDKVVHNEAGRFGRSAALKKLILGGLAIVGVSMAATMAGPCRPPERARSVEVPSETLRAAETTRTTLTPSRRVLSKAVDLERLRARGLAILATLGHRHAFASELPPGLLEAIALDRDVRSKLRDVRAAPADVRRARLRKVLRTDGHLLAEATDLLVGLAEEFPELRRVCLEYFLDQSGAAAVREAAAIARLDLVAALTAVENAPPNVPPRAESEALWQTLQIVGETDHPALLAFQEDVALALLGSWPDAYSSNSTLHMTGDGALIDLLRSSAVGVGASTVRLLSHSSPEFRRAVAEEAVRAIAIDGNEHLADELRGWATEALRDPRTAPLEARRLAWVVGARLGITRVENLLAARPGYEDLPLFHAWAYAIARATDRAEGGSGLDVLRDLFRGPQAVDGNLDPGGALRRKVARTLSTYGSSADISLLVGTVFNDAPSYANEDQAFCLIEGIPHEVWREHQDQLGRILTGMAAAPDDFELSLPVGFAAAAIAAPEILDAFRTHGSQVIRDAAEYGSKIAANQLRYRCDADVRRLAVDGLSADEIEGMQAEHWKALAYLLRSGAASVDCSLLGAVEESDVVPIETRLYITCALVRRHAECAEVYRRFIASSIEEACGARIGVRRWTDVVYLVTAHAVGGAAASRDLFLAALDTFQVCYKGSRFGDKRMQAIEQAKELITELRDDGIDYLYRAPLPD